MKRIWIPQAIAAVMLLWALNPQNPYGYYILLRWVCCAVFAYLALKALAQEKEGWVWVLAIAAMVYNPVIRIHLTREIWSVINVATVVIAAWSVFVLKPDVMDTRTNGKTIVPRATRTYESAMEPFGKETRKQNVEAPQ